LLELALNTNKSINLLIRKKYLYTFSILIYDFSDPLEMNFPVVHKPVFFYGPERKGAPDMLERAGGIAWLYSADTMTYTSASFTFCSAFTNHSGAPLRSGP
jgi:hypothetical protein